MSLRPFTVLAYPSRKRKDLDLHLDRILRLLRPRSFALHVVAQEPPLTMQAARQRCGRLLSAVHPLPAGPRRMEEARNRTTLGWRLRIKRIPVQTPSMGVSVKRHLSRIFPCLTRSLARCLSRALRQLRGSASHCVRPAGYGFQKIFSAKLRTERGRKDFPNLPKKRRLALGAGHLPSLRARVSRVRTGQIQTGEKQWHSTKTNRH